MLRLNGGCDWWTHNFGEGTTGGHFRGPGVPALPGHADALTASIQTSQPGAAFSLARTWQRGIRPRYSSASVGSISELIFQRPRPFGLGRRFFQTILHIKAWESLRQDAQIGAYLSTTFRFPASSGPLLCSAGGGEGSWPQLLRALALIPSVGRWSPGESR